MTPSPIATELRNFLKKNFQTTPPKAAPFFFGALTVALKQLAIFSNEKEINYLSHGLIIPSSKYTQTHFC